MLTWKVNKINIKKTAIVAIGLFMVVFLFFIWGSVQAQVDVPGSQPDTEDAFGLSPVEQNIALSGVDIRLIVARIIRAVLGLLGIITIVLMMYAGFTIMTAGGSEEKVLRGKKIMINAVIGIVIILSSFAIVQFVINALTRGSDFGPGTSAQIKKPYLEDFSGSGSLGKVVKDHYPERDEIGVSRNVSIVVTFSSVIDPSSLIENTNNTCWGVDNTPVLCDEQNTQPYYGDCLQVGDDFSYQEHCDHLLTDVVQIYPSNDEDPVFVEAAAITTYNKDKRAKTFVFKPFTMLGSDTEDIWYTVDLRPEIAKAVGGKSVFEDSFSGHYLWEFQTDTDFDFDPPYVVSVNPIEDEKEVPRNRIIRISFNEAINPLTVQGVLSEDSFFDNLVINFKDNDESESELAFGEWRVSNGYKTVEFTPQKECGFNSCGDLMYCLEVDCKEQLVEECFNPYSVLVRTALIPGGSNNFQAYPLTGVTDLSDNALDGNQDGLVDNRPSKGVEGDFKLIGEQEKEADNFFWDFQVNNKIDRQAPYIEEVSPAFDRGGVSGFTKVSAQFSKEMLYESLYNLILTEYPNDQDQYYPLGSCFDTDEEKKCLSDIWYYPRIEELDGKTFVDLKHREFGPNDIDFYYFVQASSEVRDENQNCLYPGYGPDTDTPGNSPVCELKYDNSGNIVEVINCVPVIPATNDTDLDTGCMNTMAVPTQDDSNPKLKSDIESCVNYLQEESF